MSSEDSVSVHSDLMEKSDQFFTYQSDIHSKQTIHSYLDISEQYLEDKKSLEVNPPMPQVRICRRNKRMASNAKRMISQSMGFPYILFADSKESFYLDPNNDHIKREIMNESLIEQSQNKSKLEPTSCLMLYIVSAKASRDIIPDYEIRQSFKAFNNLLSKVGDCHEAHFGLGKLYSHLGKMDKAINHLKDATRLNIKDEAYKLWYALVQSKSFCTTKGEALTCKMLLLAGNKGRAKIETLWGFLYLSFTKLLDSAKDIELPQFYATRIKDIDIYYGYLAWSEIFFREGQTKKADDILKALTEIYPERPEAYFKLWESFYKNRLFDGAEAVAQKGFSKISNTENSFYNIILCIAYSKTLFKQNKFRECFQVLQKHYLENPIYSVLLYKYGKFCIKSLDLTFLGTAIGALEESLKLCDEFRYGSIYY